MGYVVLHIEKAAGTDAAMSGHVERRITPANVITTLTYLNEELIEFPKGVTNRTEAIQHRLDNAGLERKIGKNQVRALRVMLSGSPEDMQRIRQAEQLDAWAKDSCGWLQKTFGKENVVSAVLHLDEKTPHIHATVVPIVRGERRKAKLEGEERPKRKENLPYQKGSSAPVRRRCTGEGQTQKLPDHLCRSNGQIRTATRHRRIGSKTHIHAAILPRGVRPQKRNGRTDRESERTAKDAHGRYCCTPSTATSCADRLQRH